MDRLRAFLQLNSLASAIIAGVLLLAIVISGIMALGLGGGLLLTFLVGIVIFFGSIRTLAGSVVVASLLKMFTAPITALLGLFVPAGKLAVLTGTLTQLHWLDSVMVVFFFAFTLTFLTGCVKFNFISVKSEVTNKTPSSDT